MITSSTLDKVETLENEGTQGQVGEVDTLIPQAQDQGVTGTTEEEKDKTEESSLMPKPKELLAIQAQVTLLESSTPSSQTL